ncbi:MAG TPA: glycoside hydrolase family protein [Tepidisphaeraceae bacterium]|nr:glycoside hydrolase family protein [Tepidisphaeraceae bacterium]
MTAEDRGALKLQLIRHEGMRLKPYRCPAGYLTVGVGRNLETRGLTADEALVLLDNDIDLCERHLRKTYAWFADLDPVRQRALIDLCFNLGTAGLAGFRKALAAMARSDYEDAATHFQQSAWYRQVGTRGPRIVGMIRTGQAA